MTTAAESYRQHRKNIDALIVRIQAGMDIMTQDAGTLPNWSDAATIAHVEEMLTDVESFIFEDEE